MELRDDVVGEWVREVVGEWVREVSG